MIRRKLFDFSIPRTTGIVRSGRPTTGSRRSIALSSRDGERVLFVRAQVDRPTIDRFGIGRCSIALSSRDGKRVFVGAQVDMPTIDRLGIGRRSFALSFRDGERCRLPCSWLLIILFVGITNVILLATTVAIVEVDDETSSERMDAVGFKNEAVEEFAPLVVVVGRRWNSIDVCFIDVFDDCSTFFFGGTIFFGFLFGMVLGVERLSSKFSLGVERRRRGGRSVSSWIGIAGDKAQPYEGRCCCRQRTTEFSRRR